MSDVNLSASVMTNGSSLKRMSDFSIQHALTAGKIGVWHWDLQSNELIWSKEQEALYGLQEGEFQGTLLDFQKFVLEEDWNRIRIMSLLDRPPHDRSFEFRIRRQDGIIRWMQSRSHAVLNEQGKVVSLTGVNIDITPLKDQQLQFEENESALNNLANAMPQLVWITTSEPKVIYYNDRIHEFYGAEQNVDGTWTWEGMCHPDDMERTMKAWSNAVESGTPYEAEHRAMMKDGAYRWQLSRAVPKKNSQGGITMWYGTSTDIHNQKQIEEKLRFATALIDNIADAVVGTEFVDNDYRIISWNKGAEFTYGWMAEEVLQQSAKSILITEYTSDEVRKAYFDALNGQGYWKGEVVQKKKDGTKINIMASVAVVNDHQGRRVGAIAVNRDITQAKRAEERLRQSEIRYSSLAQSSSSIIWTTDGEGRFVNEQHSWAKYTGQSFEEYKGWGWTSMIHPNDRKKIEEIWLDALARKTSYESEGRIWNHQEKQYRHFTSRAVPIINSSGDVVEWVGMNTDVHEQRTMYDKLEQLVAERTEKLESSIRVIEHAERSATMGNWQWNLTQNVQVWSDNLYRLFGYDREDMEPSLENFFKVIHPDDRTKVSESTKAAFEKHLPSENIFRIIRKDGTIRFIRGIGTKVTVNGDEMIIGSSQDVTALMEASEHIRMQNLKLAETQNFLQTVLNSSVELVAAMDSEMRYSFLNQRMLDFLGMKEDEVLGRHLTEVHPGMDRSQGYALLQRALKGESIHVENRQSFTRPDRILETYILPLQVKDEIIGVVTLQRDVTEVSKLTQRLKQTNEELQRSNEDLQQFAHVASHDLKEPVRKIRTYSNRIHKEYAADFPERARIFLQKIESSADRLYTMIEGILQYSSIHENSEENQVTSLNSIVDRIIDDLEMIIQEKRATIHRDQLPDVMGSSILLHQLFYNLFNNALKFTRPGVDPNLV